MQKLGVGFAGEWLACQWLAQRYGPDFTQECWVSKYREQVLPGSGDDGLGWDFEVPVRRGKHYYEVKSTLGDGGQVELGETQVRAAQENARNTSWRLLVVTNVLNENRRIRMLRNPFHPASRGLYSFVGQGLRLRYVIQLAGEWTRTADRRRANGVQPVRLPSQSDSSPGRRGRNVPN